MYVSIVRMCTFETILEAHGGGISDGQRGQ